MIRSVGYLVKLESLEEGYGHNAVGVLNEIQFTTPPVIGSPFNYVTEAYGQEDTGEVKAIKVPRDKGESYIIYTDKSVYKLEVLNKYVL